MTLGAGRFGQVLTNARHTSYSGQCYTEDVVNIIWGPNVPADAFTRGPPDLRHDARGHLF